MPALISGVRIPCLWFADSVTNLLAGQGEVPHVERLEVRVDGLERRVLQVTEARVVLVLMETTH